MNRHTLALSVGLAFVATSALPQTSPPVLTVEQLVELAFTHNREYLSLKQRVLEAQGSVRQANVGPPDSLNVNGVAGQAFQNKADDSVSLTYSHTFETFGKRGKRVAIARKDMSRAQAELDERRIALTSEVKSRYADAVTEANKLEVLDRQLANNRDYLTLTQARVLNGDAAPLEASLLQVDLNRDGALRRLADGRLRVAIMQLKATLDLPENWPVRLPDSLTTPALHESLQDLKTLALTTRPDLRIMRIAQDETASQLDLARVETKPNLTVSGQYSHADSAFDQYGLTATRTLTPILDHVDSVGLGISIPLTTAGRNRGNIEAALARQAGTKLRGAYLERLIPLQVETAYQRWQAARDATSMLTDGVLDPTRSNLAIMRQAYNLGELRLLDILNEQRHLLEIELAAVDAQRDLFRSYVELEQTTGGSLQ